MLDESQTEIGVPGEWVRGVLWARSKLTGAGTGSKMEMDVEADMMAKWSLLMLDESPVEIGVAGEWIRDVVWARSKVIGAGVDSELLMDMGPESMAKGDGV